MKVGLSTASFFLKSETEDTINILNAMGVEVCEIFLTTFREYRKEFIDMLLERKGNLEVHSIHTLNLQYEGELFNASPRTREDCEFFFRQASEAGSRLNAKYYTFHGPPRLKRKPYNINYDWMAKRLDELNAIMREYQGNCQIAYENVHWTFFSNPEFFEKLKERVDIKATLDIKQAMQSKIPVDEYIKVMGKDLVTVHLCDYYEDGALALPGQGSVDFVNLIRKLLSIGYDGPLLMELYAKNYDNFDQVFRSYEYLQNCVIEAQKG